MKTGALIRIVLWSLVAVMLTSLLAGVIAYREGIFDFEDEVISYSSYAGSKDYLVGGSSFSDNIDTLSIEWLDGSVTVEVYDGKDVEFSEGFVKNEDDRLRYKLEEGKLDIRYRRSGFNLISVGNDDKDLLVKIPAHMMDGFKSLRIDSTSAEIDVSGISAYNVIKIDNVSGEVTLGGISTDLLDINTVSGNVSAVGAVSEVKADTTSGDIEIDTSLPLKGFDSDSVSGDVRITMPDNGGFELEFDTVSGDLDSDFAFNRRGDSYIYGSGAVEFEAESVSGDLMIRQMRTSA